MKCDFCQHSTALKDMLTKDNKKGGYRYYCPHCKEYLTEDARPQRQYIFKPYYNG